MNSIIPFRYESNEVRVLQDEHGNPWWLAKDICAVLEISNAPDAMTRLDDDEKLLSVFPISGQNREAWLINEPGLYTLIIRSNKPEAKKFKRWITHEVLPAIRKTGSYSAAASASASAAKQIPLPKIAKEAESAKRLGKAFDITGRDLHTFINDIVKDRLGIDCIQMMGGAEILERSCPRLKSEPQPDHSITNFINERCITDSSATIQASLFYAAYREYCAETDQIPVSVSKFGRTVKRLFAKYKCSSIFYQGISLLK